jgi:SAM-dependent methyltransferase
MDAGEAYYLTFAAAFSRGKQSAGVPVGLDQEDVQTPLDAMSEGQLRRVYERGGAAGLRLHKFKRTMRLRRVARVIGMLRGLGPENLLDVGSGRGAFVWPLLDAMPWLPVTASDKSARRAEDLCAVRLGGLERLSALRCDATALPLADRAFDVVTFLEVLEHVPDARRAAAEAVRVARRFVVVSVPSKADDNPEHVHLFDPGALRGMFDSAGAARISFDYVPGHMIAVARVS